MKDQAAHQRYRSDDDDDIEDEASNRVQENQLGRVKAIHRNDSRRAIISPEC